jgi:hypothetical protein
MMRRGLVLVLEMEFWSLRRKSIIHELLKSSQFGTLGIGRDNWPTVIAH